MSKFETRAEYRKLYKSARWKHGRLAHLAVEPLCRYCRQQGITNDGSLTAAGLRQADPRRCFLVVDHIVPHRGDLALFWDRANWQTLCPDHHDRAKQREEVRGFSVEKGADGWPIDPLHPANR
ncbi:HNH endonuclease signature motif containing protein [Falsirhodobacter halotolerans]|uniref:HNH endonuclease signature motif containing protein n=1 Tax=Falsirhodobacter halotolerans TaxID=1146892 RepID=UPI001FD26ECE|nr:HNH endonuclease signature motif containing protein [Falsirhodobacter halotolerans]MCJ8139503.1 HNH endonuclease [Falsirhodobacter halotolerans]